MNDPQMSEWESRKRPAPLKLHPVMEAAWQICAGATFLLGLWYLHWRWTASLNPEALWFAIPLALAETLAFFGLVLFSFNLWQTWDPPQRPPPRDAGEAGCDPVTPERPISVDIYITTYNEDIDIVEISARAAMAQRYPHEVDLKVWVLDDGRRDEMRAMCDRIGCGYLSRDNNIGFKAGNLRNALENTSGDFLAICDADTRLFPDFLQEVMGYFNDPKVAWVQSPQWFYDLPEGTPLPKALSRRLGGAGRLLGRMVEKCVGPVRLGQDPFGNAGEMFYDVIQRRRNRAYAGFCCGAASIHRREAVMEAAIRSFTDETDQQQIEAIARIRKLTREKGGELDSELSDFMLGQMAVDTELTPYKFHVSEDIYTSIVLHADRERGWRSVLHPRIQARMLSPQDLLSWTVQRFKYAGGSLDILIRDGILFRKGLPWRHRLFYGATFWSYLAAIPNLIFLLSPIIYLFTGIAPVETYSLDFYLHLLPFLFAVELGSMFATWGLESFKARLFYMASFSLNIKALWAVLKGEQIKFPVTPKVRQEGNFLGLVKPQIAIAVLSMGGLLYASVVTALGAGNFTFPALVTNGVWATFNTVAMWTLIRAALWRPPETSAEPQHV